MSTKPKQEEVVRDLVATEAIHAWKDGEGWWINVWSPKYIGGYLRSGPTKTKPTKAKLRRLQWRHFQGRQVNVTIES